MTTAWPQTLAAAGRCDSVFWVGLGWVLRDHPFQQAGRGLPSQASCTVPPLSFPRGLTDLDPVWVIDAGLRQHECRDHHPQGLRRHAAQAAGRQRRAFQGVSAMQRRSS